MKSKTKSQLGFAHAQLIVFGALFAVIGSFFIYRSFAYNTGGDSGGGRYISLWSDYIGPTDVTGHIQTTKSSTTLHWQTGGVTYCYGNGDPESYTDPNWEYQQKNLYGAQSVNLKVGSNAFYLECRDNAAHWIEGKVWINRKS